jgi:polyisoprenoid-binding protein YceI
MMTTNTTSTDAIGVSPLPLPMGRWVADPAHSGIFFAVRYLGLSNVRGRFNRFDATLDVGKTLADVDVFADVDLSSVDTNNAVRDAHLRGSDFFDVERQPTMLFRSTAVTEHRDSYRLVGDLTVAGVTRPLTLEVTFNGSALLPVDQTLRAGFDATGQIRRSDFGIDLGLAVGADKVMIDDKIKIDLDLQFVASAGGGG